ncbi:PadR family transcriptional regulator [Chloroflexota bacterium]
MDHSNLADRKFQKEINSGTAALVLLKVLADTDELMYGYQIAKLLESDNEEIQLIKQGALYPVLRSLESSGLLESQVEPSISGPPRRYYSITESGHETLQRWIKIWRRTKIYVDSVLEGDSHD